MSVDMIVSSLFRQVAELYPQDRPFRHRGSYDPAMSRMSVPPYRCVFNALCGLGHARGYRLPSLDEFVDTYLAALRVNQKFARAREAFFEDAPTCTVPRPGLLHRMSRWYEDGMAHAQLYAVLVQALEDQHRRAMVVMDTRVDFKMKCDILVVAPGVTVRIEIGQGQARLLKAREDQEKERKALASGSSHWGNPVLGMPSLTVLRTPETTGLYRGLRFFRSSAIDPVLGSLEESLGIPSEERIRYRDMIDVSMADLKSGAWRRRRPQVEVA